MYKRQDPRLPEIQACLAGANCGGCGYPGCGGCAEAILAGKAPINACAPAAVSYTHLGVEEVTASALEPKMDSLLMGTAQVVMAVA